MTEEETPFIQITAEDISEANRLSLHCPICASPVESNPTEPALVPVVCGGCKTLYHRACWEQSGGKCAILGCNHDKYFVYGRTSKPALTIGYQDLPTTPSINGRSDRASQRTKELKREQQRQVEQLRRPSLLRRLWQWLLDQIRIEE